MIRGDGVVVPAYGLQDAREIEIRGGELWFESNGLLDRGEAFLVFADGLERTPQVDADGASFGQRDGSPEQIQADVRLSGLDGQDAKFLQRGKM